MTRWYAQVSALDTYPTQSKSIRQVVEEFLIPPQDLLLLSDEEDLMAEIVTVLGKFR